MKTFLTLFYLAFALLLAFIGGWLLVDPMSLLSRLHVSHEFRTASELLGRQAGLGLLLAAGINLFCTLRVDARASLHLLVLFYLLGLVLTHGGVAFGSAAWLWLPVVAYALPLLLRIRIPLPRRGGGGVLLAPGEEQGEVKWFNPTKGFGFLLGEDGREVFVHFRAVQNGGRRSLRQGQTVRFTTRQSERGEQADKVFIENP